MQSLNGESMKGVNEEKYIQNRLPIKQRNILYFIFLILLNFNINPIFAQEKTPPKSNIYFAAIQGNLDAINEHIKFGTNLNLKDQFGSTPLTIAVTFDKTEIALALINAGADLSIGNGDDSTPLHLAAFFGRMKILEVLLDKGADPFIRNISGAIAYDLVAVPFEKDKEIYDQISARLGPLGFKMDYEKVKGERKQIAAILKGAMISDSEIVFKPDTRNDLDLSSPDKEGLDSKLVREIYNDASHLETIYSLLILKNNKLIAEKYFNAGSIDQLSKRASVTKSYISALTGIAIDKGFLENTNQKMLDFFPEVKDQITDKRKKEITLRLMLQMQDGYPWEESDKKYWDAIWSGEYITKIESIPLSADPGTLFQYSNLTSNWIATIVTRAVKTDLKSFGEKHLFSLIDSKIGDWNRDVDGNYIGSGDIEFTARDMSKFGLLYLNGGKYKGERIISENWINESLKNYAGKINSVGIKNNELGRYFENIGYGFQWWQAEVGDHKFNFAWGHGGQLIVLLKDLNMIIVTTADPFWGKDLHFQSWKHEQSIINAVGKFIQSLPAK